MNCDEIFESLTSPGGHSDGDIARHLARCPRCRDLSEALLVVMNSPSLPAREERRPWQGIVDASSPEMDSTLVAIQAAERLKVASGAPPVSPSRRSWLDLRYVAAFLMGAAASLGVAAVLNSGSVSAMLPGQHGCLWLSRTETESPSNAVVLSCVACHLATPTR